MTHDPDTLFHCYDEAAVFQQLARAAKIDPRQVAAVARLLDEGNTLPFIARYRKEVTGSLDELVLRQLEDGLAVARELADRKKTVLKSIDQQGLLTDTLRQQIVTCQDKKLLEDIYLPFKPKRKTRATVARQRGLQPLADLLLAQQPLGRSRSAVLRDYVSPANEVPDEQAALDGACDIVAEQWSERADARQWLLRAARDGRIHAQVKRGKKEEAEKFASYFDHTEPVQRVPSHRFLAMMRGEEEGMLRVELALDDDSLASQLAGRLVTNPRFEFFEDLRRTARDCYDRLLRPAIESAVLQQMKEAADEDAIGVFARNLRELLLAPPAGPQVTLALDPGFRTGCKVAVVDGTGKFLETATIYPTPPRSDTQGAARVLQQLIARHGVELIAIGNGTASRETDAFVTSFLRDEGLSIRRVLVNESGASVYSASELAGKEYPDLDVTVRGAISIAHRLQDPLAELVKIDPKSIGVGQYQHDVNQTALKKSLDREVESCVNSVGVDVNMASPALLSYVAGIGPKLAERIVEYRNENGRFEDRKQLNRVPKLGAKAFEQAAGFLRIRDGRDPLDASAVHPESYHVVQRMARQLGVSAGALVGNAGLVAQLDARDFVNDEVGLPTVQDILAELAKPGRDPRKEFRTAQFAASVQEIGDLRPQMTLEGVVTNVTKFGAFVDIGVHQDGLIHVSELANTYIKDPSEVVAVGDIVRVKVLEVDTQRRRIALSRKQA